MLYNCLVVCIISTTGCIAINILSYLTRRGDNVTGELAFLAWYRFTALVERISNYGEIQNTILLLVNY